MKRTTRGWVRKAEADHLAAERLFHGHDPLHDQSCFFFEQSAEKYLKALLEELGLAVPRTHILKDLLALLLPHHASLGRLRTASTVLTRFAVATRYPGDDATRRQAISAQRSAGKVREACRAILQLPPPRRQRRRSSKRG